MSEEQTDRLEGGTPFEIRVLRELSNINRRLDGLESRMDSLEIRLTSLEEKVEARLYDTRPVWEAVLGRLDRIESKLDVFGRDLIEARTDVRALEKRLPAA